MPPRTGPLRWWDLDDHTRGGGVRQVRPTAAVSGSRPPRSGTVARLPLWSTCRCPWRDCNLRITGDTEHGERFLDSVVVI